MNEKMERSSFKDKGNVPSTERDQWIEELKRASPRKKSNSAKLQLVTNKKLLSAAGGSSTTVSSEIKFLLRQRILRKEEMQQRKIRKESDLDRDVRLPEIWDDSVDSSTDSRVASSEYITMKDIPGPKEAL